MIDAGIGPTHVNAVLSCLNIPAVPVSTLKKHENIVGPAIGTVARNSCLEACIEEREITL
jgi:hypothetical protein